MTKKIFIAVISVSLVIMLVCAGLVMGISYDYMGKKIDEQLADTAMLVEEGYRAGGQAYLDNLEARADIDSRVTLIAPDGEVLYDSSADPGGMENHMEREEVREALAGGEGFATRVSYTLEENLRYYAKKLDSGGIIRLSTGHASQMQLMVDTMGMFVVTIAVLLGLGALISYRVAKAIVQPINDIDLDHPTLPDTYEELSPLVHRIRLDMVQRDKNEQLRREFTSNVSHELKTPLTSIYGVSDMLASGIVKPEDVGGFAGTIKEESARLITLIDDIMKLSRLDENAEPAVDQIVDVWEIAQQVVTRLSRKAAQSDVQLNCTGERVCIKGADHLVDEILHNLCENAIKYNKPGGTVDVDVHAAGAKCILRVKDTGLGIPADDRQRVFERFYRVDKSHSKKIDGTGLGLSIVKHGTAFLGGTVRLESEEGVGTTITVTLPLVSG